MRQTRWPISANEAVSDDARFAWYPIAACHVRVRFIPQRSHNAIYQREKSMVMA
jgi:hypothetical protein